MEILTAVLTAVFSLISSTEFFLNNILSNTLQSKANNIEQLEIRVSTLPIHSIISGNVNNIRVASRGFEIFPKFKIDILDLEIDQISINYDNLNLNNFEDLKQHLRIPIQGGINIVLKEKDINFALQSEDFKQKIENIFNKNDNSTFELINLEVDLLSKNKIQLFSQFKINPGEEILRVNLQFDLEVVKGSKIRITNVTGTLNEKILSESLLEGFADNFNQQLDLHQLEASDITLRILKLNITDEAIQLASFIRIMNNKTN